MVATFFPQRTNAFILFLIVPSLQISCFRKTKEKQYQKYDLNKRIAASIGQFFARGAVNHLPKKFSQVAQIFTKQ